VPSKPYSVLNTPDPAASIAVRDTCTSETYQPLLPEAPDSEIDVVGAALSVSGRPSKTCIL